MFMFIAIFSKGPKTLYCYGTKPDKLKQSPIINYSDAKQGTNQE